MTKNEGGRISRDLGAFSTTNIVVANIVGAGIFTTTGIMAGMLPGPWWIVGCWVLGGLIAMAGALCYAELATRMPEEGAEYTYLRRLYHPSLGFLTGWTSLVVGFSAAVAASAIGFSEYLFAGIDGPIEALGPAWLLALKKGTAIAVIALFTGLHYLGLRLGSRVQNALTIVKILIVVGLAGAGLLTGDGGSFVSAGGNGFTWTSLGTAMMLVMFSYSGWNASAYIAGEVKRPRRNLPVSLLAGTGIVLVLYALINLFILHALPFGEIRGTIPVVERAAVTAFGPWIGRTLSLLVGVALLSSLSAYTLIGPRVYFAMARDRLFFSFAARVHPRHGVPGRSILIQGGLALVMVLAGSFEQLLVYLGFALGIFPWLAVFGLFIARRRRIGEETAVRTPAYPLVPVFFLVTTLCLMVVAFVNRPMESSIAIATVLLGVPCYALWTRAIRRGGAVALRGAEAARTGERRGARAQRDLD